MFNRVRHGVSLTRKAWAVIRSHPGLIRFPLVGGALALVALAVLGVPGALLVDRGEVGGGIGGIVLLALSTYLASFSMVYFNVILVAAADQALRGEKPDSSAARGVARDRKGQVALWALVSAGVSIVLSALRRRGGTATDVGAAFAAEAWSLVTFLVVPVLSLEGIGPFVAIKRSAALFRQRWGQQVTGDVVIGGVSGMIALVGIIIGVLGLVLLAEDSGSPVAGYLLLAVGMIICVAGSVFRGATRGVLGVALYRYVADDHALEPFTAADLNSATKTQ